MSLAFLGFAVIWQVVSGIAPIGAPLFPPPLTVAKVLYFMASNGELLSDVLLSLQRALIGFLLGSVCGIAIGLLTGRLKVFDLTLGQLARLFRSVPSIALVPLAIVWFGLGELSKYMLVFWGVFFPVWINAHLGASQVERVVIWAARSLGARKQNILYEIVLPSCLPFVIAGMRTGIAIAFVVLVAAEMAGAFGGIGYRIYASHLVFRVDKMIAGILTLGAVGALADLVFAGLIRSLPWHKEHQP